MKTRRAFVAAALAAGVGLATFTFAKDVALRLRVVDAWTRPTMAGMPMGVAYFRIVNDTDLADVLVSASTRVAARVEMHETRIENGMARMRPLAEIRIPARSTVAVAPNGIHLMLVDLNVPLAAGTKIPMTLRFRNTGRVDILLSVETRSE